MNTLTAFFIGVLTFFSGIFSHGNKEVPSTPTIHIAPVSTTTRLFSSSTTETTSIKANKPKFESIGVDRMGCSKMSITTDGSNILINSMIVVGADPKSFRALSDEYSKDDKNAYYKGVKIDDADASSFGLWEAKDSTKCNYIDKRYASDLKNVYCGRDDGSVEVIDRDGFRLLGESGLSANNKNIYHGCYDHNPYKINKDKDSLSHPIDYPSLEYVQGGYYKDKNDVYVWNTDMEVVDEFQSLGINPKEFRVLKNGFSRDNNNLYFARSGKYGDIKLKNGDPDSFRTINTYYSEDKNNVYVILQARYKDSTPQVFIIKNADVNSFEAFGPERTGFSKDKNNVYLDGTPIKWVDPKTVRHIYNTLISDDNAVYYVDYGNYSNGWNLPLKIDGVDAKTLKIIDQTKYIYQDRNNKYKFVTEEDGHGNTLSASMVVVK